ncbi:hypothetical protein E1211_29755 [Micromonospora sp. 15K316]|uniref:DUF2637 domain-containing protein n=1 Tax=Micromonospora sp. 15K316 TaxID=2530376 RepID=UPI0010EE0833|nr:DUF2637 domain-containing protein [Micromonospora sp. 15K316]TDC26884.1 hypothetical protein E1211_29755 [Micromonospora sp. 15K316]
MTVEHTTAPGHTAALAANIPTWQAVLDTVGAALNQVPGWAWLALATALFAGLVVMRRLLDKAHRAPAPKKTGEEPKTGNEPKKLGKLFVAAVVFAGLLWTGVLVGSGRNLIGWGRDTLGWRNGWDWLVPATLDGVAIAFAVLMFVAVQVGRPTGRAYRVVWGATITSAAIGFSHEYDGTGASLAAAVYLGLLAVGAMAILHELLDLFRAHTAKKVARVNPVFGLRWFTYTPNTLCAWLAWQNHPPRPLRADASDEDVAWYGSVGHAVRHLGTVRRAKRIAAYRVDRYAGALPPVGWARVLLWLRVRQLGAALVHLRETSAAELDARDAAHAAELTGERQAAEAALAAERERHAVEVEAVRRELSAARAELDAALAQLDTTRRELATTIGLFETASAELDEAVAGRRAAEQRAVEVEAQAERARVEAIAARQVTADTTVTVERLTGQLRDAQQECGRLAATTEHVRAAVDDEWRRRVAELTARHDAEVAATVERMTADRDAAVAAARDAAVAAARDAVTPGRRDAVTAGRRDAATGDGDAVTPTAGDGPRDDATAVTPPLAGRRGGGGQDRAPRRPPWSDAQAAAFDYRAKHPAATWVEIAEHVGKPEATVRRWFRWRDEHDASVAAVPTTPILSPKEPVTSGTNGTTVKP